MGIRLDDEARSYLATFTAETDVSAVDCVVYDDVVAFVVPPDDMAAAIGPDGRTVRALERRLDREVVLVEGAERVEDFVANALAPAAVYDVERAEETAIARVHPADVGVAIGTDGERIERARDLVARHFELADIDVVPAESRSANEDA